MLSIPLPAALLLTSGFVPTRLDGGCMQQVLTIYIIPSRTTMRANPHLKVEQFPAAKTIETAVVVVSLGRPIS